MVFNTLRVKMFLFWCVIFTSGAFMSYIISQGKQSLFSWKIILYFVFKNIRNVAKTSTFPLALPLVVYPARTGRIHQNFVKNYALRAVLALKVLYNIPVDVYLKKSARSVIKRFYSCCVRVNLHFNFSSTMLR